MESKQPSPDRAPAFAWREAKGRWITVRAAADSFAASLVAVELNMAEGILDDLEELLKPAPSKRAPITIYLAELPLLHSGKATQTQGGRHSVLRVVSPEGSNPPLDWSLAHVAVETWFGTSSCLAPQMIDGIAGLVASKEGLAPPLPMVEEGLLAQMNDDFMPSSLLREDDELLPPQHDEGHLVLAAASFVNFLIRRFGADALRQYLSSYDPARKDHAALEVYQHPIRSLQDAWIKDLWTRRQGAEPWKKLFRYLLPLLRPFRWRMTELLTYMLLGTVTTIAIPLASKHLIDDILPPGDIGGLVQLVLGLLILFLFDSLLDVRTAYVSSGMNMRVLLSLQEQMFRTLHQLSHDFYARAKIGDLMTRLSSDLGIAQQAMAQVTEQSVASVLSLVAAAATILILSPQLGALVLIGIPLMFITHRFLGARLAKASYEQQERVAETQTFLQESLSAHSVVKAFCSQERTILAFAARLRGQLSAALRLVLLGGIFESNIGFATALPQLAIMGLGGYWVITGRLTLGELVAFLGLLPSVFQPITSLSAVGQAVQEASGALERVSGLLEEPVTITDAPDATPLSRLNGDIRLQKVSFAYSATRPVLEDVSMDISAGSNVAIVGPSGSGKSTIVNLLLRFWDPLTGAVLLDKRDIRKATITSVRSQIGVVFQDTFVFATTLRENIALGRSNVTDAEVSAAAEAAQLGELLSQLPAGLDTVMSEGGGQLSGGQRQRLAIARAVLSDPPILVLDEATSALDPQTERDVLGTLAHVSRGRTTITITHRLRLAVNTDSIFVMAQGRVVEWGSHADLVRAGGLYQALFEEQSASNDARVNLSEVASFLRIVPLFNSLSDEQLSIVARKVKLRHYPEDCEIVRQGDAGNDLYVLRKGRVAVFVEEGELQREVNSLVAGDYFGEVAILSGASRTATVRSTTPTEVLSLAREDFSNLLQSDPAFADAVHHVMEQRTARYAFVSSAAGAAQPG